PGGVARGNRVTRAATAFGRSWSLRSHLAKRRIVECSYALRRDLPGCRTSGWAVPCVRRRTIYQDDEGVSRSKIAQRDGRRFGGQLRSRKSDRLFGGRTAFAAGQ